MVVTTGGNVTWTGKSGNALSYSTDNGATWSTASSNVSLTVSEGDKVLWKGTTTPVEYQGMGKFNDGTNVRYSVEGNAMSLLFGDDFKEQTSLTGKSSAFMALFSNNTNVTNAKNLSLPATTLVYGCYYQMFEGCTSLTTAPELPATTLVTGCYSYMFKGCTSLTTAPELPATRIINNCYESMFEGCTSLTTAPELPATELAPGCYRSMFKGCTSLNSITCLATSIQLDGRKNWVDGVAASGTFTKSARISENSWGHGTSNIPTGWTVVDA